MKYKFLSIIYVALAAVLWSCTDDVLSPDLGLLDDSPLKFSVNTFTVNGTRAAEPSDNPEPESEQEKRIQDFWLFVFNPDGTQLAAPVYYSIPADGATLNEVTKKAYAALPKNAPMTLYVVANTDDADWVKAEGFATLSEVKNQKLDNPAPIVVTNNRSNEFYIPMSGELANVTATNDNVLIVPVTRMYAKIKVQANFPVEEMKLYDADISGIPWYCKVYQENEEDPVTGEPAAVPLPDGTWMTSLAFTSGDAVTENDGKKWLVMYIPENRRGEFQDADKDIDQNIPEQALSVRIKAKYRGSDFFFTVYPGENTFNNFNIRRNCVYRVTVDVRKIIDQHNPSSNCFVVEPGDMLAFEPYYRVETGGGFKIEDYLNPDDDAKKINKLEIIWQTKDCIGDNTNGDLVYLENPDEPQHLHSKIVVHTQEEGNALVAARNAAGDIVWSWHIWVTPNQPDNLGNAVRYTTYEWGEKETIIQTWVPGGFFRPGHYETDTVTGIFPFSDQPRVPGYAVMNCNLGALEYMGITPDGYFDKVGDALKRFPKEEYRTFGMVYQWGRKDPFPPVINYTGGNNDGTSSPNSTPGYLDYVTKYTGVHFANDNKTIVSKTAKLNSPDSLFNSVLSTQLTETGVNYSIKHPTIFIAATNQRIITSGSSYRPTELSNGGDWLPEGQSNDELWGGLKPDLSQKHMDLGKDAMGNEIYVFDNYGNEKSVFDPCPAGWRVPPGDLWLGFTKTGLNPDNYGYTSANDLPTVGEPHYEDFWGMADVNWDRSGSGMFGMLMYMQGWRRGATSYFPLQGTRIGVGYCFNNGWCGNYHNATCSRNNRVNILHLHQNPLRMHLFEIENREYYIKSTASPIRCVRDKK